MTFQCPELVAEYTNIVGTGDPSLNGAVAGYRTFKSVLSDGDVCVYTITGPASEESGFAVYHASSNTLTRTSVISSTNGNNKVIFAAGAKMISITAPVSLMLPTIIPPPVLDIDLMNAGGALDPRVTFTRPSTAAYYTAAGLLATAAINAPRFDYDPVSHALNGVLVESASTNLLLQSNDLTTTWNGSNSGATTITNNAVVSPDGATNAASIVNNSATTFSYGRHQGPITITAGASYVLSVFAKKKDYQYLTLRVDGSVSLATRQAHFDLQNGTATIDSGTTGVTAVFIQNVGNGWYRCAMVVAMGASDTTADAYFFYTDSATLQVQMTSTIGQGVYIYGSQFEPANLGYPTSYIATTAAQVTRAGDALSVPTSAFGFNPMAGSYVLEYMTPNAAVMTNTPRTFIQVGGGGVNGILVAAGFPSGSAYFKNLSNTAFASAALDTTTFSVGSPGRIALGYSAASVYQAAAGVLNGVTAGAGFVANDAIAIILSGNSVINAWQRRLTYWNFQLPPTMAQLLTFPGVNP
jgi:hypothetical protein